VDRFPHPLTFTPLTFPRFLPSVDTSLIITGSADNTARLWEIKSGRLLHTWEVKTAVKWVAFSSDKKYALLVTEKRMGFPGTITIVEIKGANEERQCY
jgi:translation initiation factor 3 subunit I